MGGARGLKMRAFYNEHDRFAAAWLRELIKAGLIADGVVDERDIQQIEATELREFTQCHFFAGIGVWSYALRAAGWSDDTPVWTGSCPCQSFSASGKREGFSDERHLWPAWFRLLRECRPDTVFGEQVASKDGLAWFDIVSSDLEGEGYAVGAADTCAAGFGCPGIRQRLYFVGDSGSAGRGARRTLGNGIEESAGRIAAEWSDDRTDSDSRSNAGLLACADGEQNLTATSGGLHAESGSGSSTGILVHPESNGREQGWPESERQQGRHPRGLEGRSLTNGFWRDAEWLWCRDQKYRPVEAGTFPLASGIKNRVGKLRGYGNALNAEQAKGFVEAFLAGGSERGGF